MIIEAEFDEIENGADELDFAETTNLPWLEVDEEDDGAGGIDKRQLGVFVGFLTVLAAAIVGAVWIVSNYAGEPEAVADGSTIAAPEAPIKRAPEETGGKEFAGTGDVAPGVGQGVTPDARLADATEAAPEPTFAPSMAQPAASPSAPAPTPTPEPTRALPPPPPAATGVGVQVGAYSTRARAQQGWRTLQSQSRLLVGLKNRILEGQADSGTVFRLQAVTPTHSEARTLCLNLKREGLDCAVMPKSLGG